MPTQWVGRGRPRSGRHGDASRNATSSPITPFVTSPAVNLEQIVATGAGAALALDFVGYVRANKLVPLRPVTVCYSSASLPLLQFVTNTLLAERIHGIEIKTALTRHDDLEVRESRNTLGTRLSVAAS